MAGKHKTTSPYLNTPIKDFYLDVMVKRSIPSSSNDELVTIEAKYDERPDLFANDYFGSPRLWWVLATRNMDTLVDPIGDFKTGVQIFVPNPETIQDIV